MRSESPGDAARPLAPGRAPPDEELVREVLAGSPARFALLVRRHQRRLGLAVHRVLRDRSEEEDVVQQAFTLAFAGLGGWGAEAPFGAWLRRIAVHEALLRLRRARLARRAEAAVAGGAEGPGTSPEAEASRREALGRVEEALPRLPRAQRDLLRLLAEGLSPAELAGRLGIREGAARVRAHRARAALRALLGGPAPRRGDPPLLTCAGRGGRAGDHPAGAAALRADPGAGWPPSGGRCARSPSEDIGNGWSGSTGSSGR